MKQILATLALIFATGFSVPAHAEDAVGESLDWLVVSRPHIAIEEVTGSVLNNKTDATNTDLEIQTRLKKVLKGQPSPQTSFVRHWQASAVPGEQDTARPANGTEYLLFFDAQNHVTNAINLRFPSRKLGLGADPKDVALATDFDIIKTREVILDTVKRRLDQLSGNHASKRLEVPMDTPAWGALYQGSLCYLLVPDEPQVAVAPHVIEFSGLAFVGECRSLPKASFEIKDILPGQAHTLSIACHENPDDVSGSPQKLTLTFRILDILRQADYEFRWGSNPDALPAQKGFFTDYRGHCEEMLQMLQSRANAQTPLENSEGAPPMQAQWHADCLQDDRWGTVMEFYLSVRSENKS